MIQTIIIMVLVWLGMVPMLYMILSFFILNKKPNWKFLLILETVLCLLAIIVSFSNLFYIITAIIWAINIWVSYLNIKLEENNK